jgi:hypothetical protein
MTTETTRDPDSRERLMDGIGAIDHVYKGVNRAIMDGIQARARELAVKIYKILERRGDIEEILEAGKTVLPTDRHSIGIDERKAFGIPADVWEAAGVRGERATPVEGGNINSDAVVADSLGYKPDLKLEYEFDRTLLLLRETMEMLKLLTHPQETERSHPDELAGIAVRMRAGAVTRAERDSAAEVAAPPAQV